MISYEFKKGELTKFNNLNQELKTIFNEYSLSNTGHIVGDSILEKGSHIAYTDFRMYLQCDDDKVFIFDSQKVYIAIKENKKNIKCITILYNKIYFTGDNYEEIIGTVSDMQQDYYDIFKRLNKNIISQSSIYNLYDNHSIIKMEDYNVSDLCNNKYINISADEYRTRITKEIIPGIKKSSIINLEMYRHNSDKMLFHLLITVYRSSCTSFHLYTCLKI